MSSPCAPASSLADAVGRLEATVRECRRCEEAGYLATASPRLLGLGRLAAEPAPRPPRLMVIGQAPARNPSGIDWRQRPYARAIAGWLTRAGFTSDDPSTVAYFSALTHCYPGPSRHGNGDRAPSRAEMALCREYVIAELALLRPAVVLLVGGLAMAAFGGRGPLTAAIGHWWERDGVRYLPMPHPSGASRWHNVPANRDALERALALLAAWRIELALDAPPLAPR